MAELTLLSGRVDRFGARPPSWSVTDEPNTASKSLDGGIIALAPTIFAAAEHPLASNRLSRSSGGTRDIATFPL